MEIERRSGPAIPPDWHLFRRCPRRRHEIVKHLTYSGALAKFVAMIGAVAK